MYFSYVCVCVCVCWHLKQTTINYTNKYDNKNPHMLQIQQTKKQYMKKMWSNASNLLAQTFIATTLQTAHKNCVPSSKCGEQNKKIYTQHPAFFPFFINCVCPEHESNGLMVCRTSVWCCFGSPQIYPLKYGLCPQFTNIKWLTLLPILMQNHSGGDSVALSIISLAPHLLGCLTPPQVFVQRQQTHY